MALGRIIKKSRGFGIPIVSLQAGAPQPYDLEWFAANSWLGVPFYHFMSNWETMGASHNFTKMGGGPAVIRDRVESWKNTYLPVGAGDAVVAKDYNGDNYFGIDGYPTLVETDYYGKKFKGLKFTGTEYLQINGSTVNYGTPDPIFSTGGTSWAGNTGATFLFVIDQDPINDTTVNPLANGIQSLLISRQPVGGSQLYPAGYTWPQTEFMGIQYFRQGSTYSETSLNFSEQRWGPDSTQPNIWTGGIPITKAWDGTVAPMGFLWGGAVGGTWQPTLHLDNHTKPGLQAILLEYDNTDQFKFDACSSPIISDRDYQGPTVKLWGMCKWLTSGPRPWHLGGGFDGLPALIGQSPALKDWTLFDRENAFLGGAPPVKAQSPQPGAQVEYGNGFRGIIYEVMMLEGILSPRDKQRLQKILERKYPLK